MKTRTWIMVAFMFVIYVINAVDKSVIGIIAGPVMQQFGLSAFKWGIVGSSFFWVYIVMCALGGQLADKFNTKRILIVLAVLWAAAQFGQSLVQSFGPLVSFRALLGAFEGPFFAVAIVHISQLVPAKSRSKAISIFQYGSMIGSSAVAPLLVYLTAHYGWRGTLRFLALSSVVWAIVYIFFRLNAPSGSEEVVPVRSAAPHQKIDGDLNKVFINPTFIVCCAASFIAYWTVSWMFSWFPIYVTNILGHSRTVMGNMIMGVGIIGGLITIFAAALVDRRYRIHQSYKKAHAFIIGVLLCVSAVLLVSILGLKSTAWVIVVFALTQGAATFIFNIASQIATRLFPSRGGLLVGVVLAFGGLGASVGPVVTGFIISLAGASGKAAGFNDGLLLIAFLLLVAGVLFLFFVDPEKNKRAPARGAANRLEAVS